MTILYRNHIHVYVHLPLLSDPSDIAPNTRRIEVVFETGSQEENVSIGIINDDSYENTESFTVVIVDISSNVEPGQNNSTQVNIVDDEVLIGSATLISPTTITEGEQIQYTTRVVVPPGGLAVNLTLVFNITFTLITSEGEHLTAYLSTYIRTYVYTYARLHILTIILLQQLTKLNKIIDHAQL